MTDAATRERLAYRIEEFCALTGISRPWAYSLMKEGKLPFVKVGSRRLIPAEAARRLLSGQGADAA